LGKLLCTGRTIRFVLFGHGCSSAVHRGVSGTRAQSRLLVRGVRDPNTQVHETFCRNEPCHGRYALRIFVDHSVVTVFSPTGKVL